MRFQGPTLMLIRHVTFAITGGSSATQSTLDARTAYCIIQAVRLALQAARHG